MGDFDCPFRAIKKVLADIQKETPIILVDFHAEATSEKAQPEKEAPAAAEEEAESKDDK